MSKPFHLNAGMFINFELTTRMKVMSSNGKQYVLRDARSVFTFVMLHHHNNLLINFYVHYMQG